MALLQECPTCRKRHSISNKECSCGFALGKASGKVYWIEYYLSGHRKRERIGTNKAAAENRLREVLTKRTEGRYIHKAKDLRLTFDDLAKWYLQLPQIQAKSSYDRDALSIRTLSRFFSGLQVRDITNTRIGSYREQRLSEDSCRKNKTKPATINREVACLRHMLNLAKDDKLIESMPCDFKKIKSLDENNVRERVLSSQEYEYLLTQCPLHTAQVVKMGYYTGMRFGEIITLKWDRIDIDSGMIRLRPEDTKTKKGRVVPLHPELIKMLQDLPHHQSNRVFLFDGEPVKSIRKSFITACKNAGVEGLWFHDFRHTAINNWRLQGHDYFRIMAVSGHKTMSVFKRYNTISEEEIKKLVQAESA